jgi:urease accessory protein
LNQFACLDPVMQLISGPFAPPDLARPEITLNVSRIMLAKRLWRGTADDGMEFGFELAAPLQHGETFWQTAAGRYVVRQQPESVVEVLLDLPPSAAAGIGWAIGNLHLELSAEPGRLLAPDEPAVRQLLDRLGVPFRTTTAVFRPGRFARQNLQPHDLGPGHKH